MSDSDTPDDSDVMDEWADALNEAGDAETPEVADSKPTETDEVEKAELSKLKDTPSGDIDVSMEVLLDIPVTISMEIGRTKINIRNLLQLNQGSVVELDRLAGEPLDVIVNGTLIAHGEVVVVNEKFGIRLTDVISPAERVKKLK